MSYKIKVCLEGFDLALNKHIEEIIQNEGHMKHVVNEVAYQVIRMAIDKLCRNYIEENREHITKTLTEELNNSFTPQKIEQICKEFVKNKIEDLENDLFSKLKEDYY